MKAFSVKVFLSLIIFLSLSQCKKHTVTFNQNKLEEIKKNFGKFPVTQRVKKWDSLIRSDTINELTKAYLMFEKANDLQNLEKNNKSIENYQSALLIFEKFNKNEMIAKTFVNMGISHAYLNHKKSATKYILKGLKIGEKLNNDYIKSRAYGELAHIYYLNNNKEKAIEYLKKTGKMYQNLKDTAALSAIFNNIGIIYREKGRIKEAYNYTLKSLRLKDSIANPIGLIESLNNLGRLIYLYKKDKKQAIKYYQKALKIAHKIQYNSKDIYKNLSLLYKETGELDSAKYYIKKALKPAPDNYKERIGLYNTYLLLLLKQKKDSEALSILKIKDSLFKLNQELNDKINEKNIENKLAILSQQKQLEQARQLNKKNRIIFIFIIIIFILGLLISYQLNRVDSLKYKQERFLLEQKVLLSQMNPHFIFNVLSSIQNSLIENKPIISATYLAKFAQLIRQNFDFIQKKNISLKEELKMLRNYLDTQSFRYKEKFDYQINIDPSINQANTEIPPMILQPFVENAIEHGFKQIDYKGQLIIKIFKKQEKICFEITDNGSGYNPKNDQKEHALDIFKKRLKLMGKEAIDSYEITKLGQGTKIVFCLPHKELLPIN